MILTGRLALVALPGVMIVGFAVPTFNGVLLVTGALIALALVDAGLAASVRQVGFDRSGESRVRLGESANVTLAVRNSGRRRLHGQLRDGWPPSAGAAHDRFDLDIRPGERQRFTASLTPTRRGDRHADRVTVRSYGPLRLAGRQGTHSVPWTVRVLPPFHSRKHLPSRLARLRDLDGRSAIRIRGEGTEFDSLRKYVIGDDVRSIDWRASARRSDVVVRTWQPERDRHVLIVIDSGRLSAGRVADEPRLDAAIEAAQLLGALANRAGDRVDLLAFDRRVRVDVSGSSSNEVLPRMVDALARLESELVETDHRALVAEIVSRASRHAFVVLITGLDAGTVEDGLLPVFGELTRRHTVLVAAVADPKLDAMAADRSDAHAVYGAAAAERAGRAHVAEDLVKHGAIVVDTVPDKLAPAVADAYLDLKALGRL
jgi:uncharacterized protein (DUF58 family)